MKNMIVGLAALGLMLGATTACTAFGSHPVPSGPSETLMLGWERNFTLDWDYDVIQS
jgi:hypothetical protein